MPKMLRTLSLAAAFTLSLCGCDMVKEKTKENIDHAKIGRAQAEMQSHMRNIDLYATTHQGKLPRSLSDASQVTSDPWGQPYTYKLLKRGKSYELRSAGPDGTSGTDDDLVLGP